MTMTTVIILAVCVLVIFTLLPLVVRKVSCKNKDASCGISSQIYVGNLPYRTNERDLRRFFDRYGEIKNVRVIRDQHSGRSRGFAFVTYEDNEQAQNALRAHGEDMYGRQMVVRIAKARD